MQADCGKGQTMEDSDIKIFGKEQAQSCDDELRLISLMEEERANGNIDKATRLGDYLAEIFLDEDGLLQRLESVVGELDYPQNILFQIKILLFFAAEYTINRTLPNTVLKSTAINALYGNIKDGDGAFYAEFSDGAEYSFYYLAMRKESASVIAEIGKAFAMLCGKENEKNFTELGKNLFNLTVEEVEHIIHIFAFTGV